MKLIPATVASWDGITMRIHIPGYTDGADVAPKAEVLYPLADRPHYTGYKILPGDAVWVVFNDNDVNQPIVIGFRNAKTGESKETRRLTHKDMEFMAENELKENSQTHKVNAASLFEVVSGSIVLKGDVKIEGKVDVVGKLHAQSVTDDDGDGGA